MNRNDIFNQIIKKKSFLCIGLDTDLNKIPKHLLDFEDPIFEFNKRIINKTKDLCIAYKPNLAFYECLGPQGIKSLEKTINYIPDDIFTIADAKRGDIGNTTNKYAEAFFKNLNFDAITVSPYMGSDSVKPFLEYKNKWVILLALTSNNGSLDFQTLEDSEGYPLYKKVLSTSKNWGNQDNLMYVVGATKFEELQKIRKIIPDHFLLVPGVGAQGGTLSNVAKFALNKQCGLLVNCSRSIIYAGNCSDFDEYARKEAFRLQTEMSEILEKYF